MTEKIEIPTFLEKQFLYQSLILTNLNNLYVGLIPSSSFKPKFVSIFDTPHYHFVQKIIYNRSADKPLFYKNYEEYVYMNKTSCNEKEYIDLINNIDVGICASKLEAFGRVTVEYMLASKLVIASLKCFI